MCRKPMAKTDKEVDQRVRLVDANRRPLSVAFLEVDIGQTSTTDSA